jgi:hexulose-6-phosphate isomerase
LATEGHIDGLRHVLADALRLASDRTVELHLETDLEPAELAAVLGSTDHPWLRANLDMGNSASLGHDPRLELEQIGPWLGSVHVKDRVRGGGTVPLGSGDADLETYFALLAELGYRGSFILQAARSAQVSEVDWCRRNRKMVEGWLRALPLASGERSRAPS